MRKFIDKAIRIKPVIAGIFRGIDMNASVSVRVENEAQSDGPMIISSKSFVVWLFIHALLREEYPIQFKMIEL